MTRQKGSLPGGVGEATALLSRRLATAIQRYPNGRYGLVGSMPVELTVPRGGMFPGRNSMSWDTEQAVIDALLAIGITHFQLDDCSWYDRKSRA